MTDSDAARERASANGEIEITLGLLTAIERNSGITQRSLAKELGIALGLANTYLKRCAKKGLIKIAQVPSNRYTYYLTPQGFAEKSRLTTRYLAQSFLLFRHARNQYDDLLSFCALRGWRRIAFAGISELADIAVLCAPSRDVAVAGILTSSGTESFRGLPVVDRLKKLGSVDAVIITEMAAPQIVFDALVQIFPRERILAPLLLNVSTEAPKFSEAPPEA